MSAYALIKDGIVVNAVLWDGKGDIFSDYEIYEIKDGDQVGPGSTAEKDSKGNWIFTPPVIVLTPEQIAEKNLQSAQAEYNLASSMITALNQRIEDEDYSKDYTEEQVASDKSKWTSYRKLLRAYIAAADGSKPLPDKITP